MDGLGEAGEGGAVPLQGEPHELGPGVVQELFGDEVDNMIIRLNIRTRNRLLIDTGWRQ